MTFPPPVSRAPSFRRRAGRALRRAGAGAHRRPTCARSRATSPRPQSMTADFIQTDGKGRQLAGTLQLKRPGKIRFEYGGGVNMLLVANGKTLSFIDYEVGQKSSWPIAKSPLAVLLSAKPDLGRIARVVPSERPARRRGPRPRCAPARIRHAGPAFHAGAAARRAGCGSKAGPRSTRRTRRPRSACRPALQCRGARKRLHLRRAEAEAQKSVAIDNG